MDRIRIEYDYDYDPASSVDWSEEETAAYVQRFNNGELYAVGIIVERQCKCCQTWLHKNSLWGIDLETNDPGILAAIWKHGNDLPITITVEEARALPGYLGDVVADMVREPIGTSS